MAYLITGGTGLVGARIVRNLLKDGNRVIAYDYRPDQAMLDMVIGGQVSSNFQEVAGDVLDFDFLVRTIEENGVDTIVHFAAILGDAIKDNPRKASNINVDGTINVFEAARVLHLKKVVWASSNAVFPVNLPYELPRKYKLDEVLFSPWGLYGASKLYGEHASDYYFEQFGVDITAVRYGPMLFGAGQQRGRSGDIIRELVLKPAAGQPGRVPFGDAILHWLYAEDAARAAVLATKVRRAKTAAYNIGGYEHPVKELFEYVKGLLPGAEMELLPGYFNGPRYDYDTSPAERDLGFHPQHTVKEGIKESINIVRQQNGLPLI
jgi:UDP-glucose 4-epimerase